MENRIPTNRPRITSVQKILNETSFTRTLFFNDVKCSKFIPGQFAMIWFPGIGEVPMSISFADDNGLCGITIKSHGPTSNALYEAKKGDIIGIRGPYGNGFTLISGSILVVGGGTGLSPLLPLTYKLMEKKSKITFLLAGVNKFDIPFLKKAEQILSDSENKIIISTDDGSEGFKGVAPDYVDILLQENEYDMIYTCGPEIMMKKIFLSAEKNLIPFQASLERYMKCGFGLCGSCSLGNYLVCKDGPVFTSEQLREVPNDFGISRRDHTGQKMSL